MRVGFSIQEQNPHKLSASTILMQYLTNLIGIQLNLCPVSPVHIIAGLNLHITQDLVTCIYSQVHVRAHHHKINIISLMVGL